MTQLKIFNDQSTILMGEKAKLKERLRSLLNTKLSGSTEEEKELQSDKRRNEIEKTQLSLYEISLSELQSEFYSEGAPVSIDTSYIKGMKKHCNQWLITYDGEIINPYSNSDKNVWYDSKTFDAVVPIIINGKEYTFFSILKGVENSGGHQDDVKKEIGLYSKLIQKNKDEGYHFIFQLDGRYINKDIDKLDKSDKYEVSSTENIKEIFRNFINKHLN